MRNTEGIYKSFFVIIAVLLCGKKIFSMKNLFIILLSLSLFSCKNEDKKESLYPEFGTDTTEGTAVKLSPEAQMGQEIFDGKGNCYSCHKPDQKVVGPSIQEIAKIYKAKNGDIVKFLKGDGEPIVDPSQYEVMKTNFYLTKTFSDKELEGIEAYMLSIAP